MNQELLCTIAYSQALSKAWVMLKRKKCKSSDISFGKHHINFSFARTNCVWFSVGHVGHMQEKKPYVNKLSANVVLN